MSSTGRWSERFRQHPGYAPLRVLIGLLWVGGAIALGVWAARLLPSGTAAARPLLVAAAALLAYGLFVRIVERRRVDELVSARWWLEALVGLAIGATLFALVIGTLALLGAYAITGVNGVSKLTGPLAVAIMSGVTEELMLRAILFRILERWLGSVWSLAISALLFGLLHLPNPHATLISSLAIALKAGILLAAAYMVTQRIWLAIGIHVAWNFTQSGVFGVASSGLEMPGYFASRLTGPTYLSGGSFGPETSIVAVLVCTVAGGILLQIARSRGHWQPRPRPSESGSA